MSRRHILVALAATFLLLVAGVLWIYFGPKGSDPLCEYMHSTRLECLALVADAQTYRPGAIAAVAKDPVDSRIDRVDLPSSYLDQSCVVPGTSPSDLTASPSPQEFDLRSVSYSNSALGRVNGKLSKGVTVNLGPRSDRIQEVSLSFGSARTTLLDELSLIQRIESCSIKLSCVENIRSLHYKVINRVLVVEKLSYTFKDSRGATLSIADLSKEGAIAVEGTFDLANNRSESLVSSKPLAIGVQLISQEALDRAKPCLDPVLFKSEGAAEVSGGGGGARGHIPESGPSPSMYGKVAALELVGSESTFAGRSSQSFIKATAHADVQSDHEVLLNAMVDVKGGHYDNGTPQDTSAHAIADARGQIDVLARKPGTLLKVAWTKVPQSNASAKAEANIAILGPDSRMLTQLEMSSGDGSKEISLPQEGRYLVRGEVRLTAESKGAELRATLAASSGLSAQVRFGNDATAGHLSSTGYRSSAKIDPAIQPTRPIDVPFSPRRDASDIQRTTSKSVAGPSITSGLPAVGTSEQCLLRTVGQTMISADSTYVAPSDKPASLLVYTSGEVRASPSNQVGVKAFTYVEVRRPDGRAEVCNGDEVPVTGTPITIEGRCRVDLLASEKVFLRAAPKAVGVGYSNIIMKIYDAKCLGLA